MAPWQGVGSRPRDACRGVNPTRQEVRVATKTTDDMLADVRRHIDELEARADGGAAETRARLQDRFDRLREEEASAWAAVRAKAEAVDEKFRELEIDIAIAENRLASEMAERRDLVRGGGRGGAARLGCRDRAAPDARSDEGTERSRAGRGRDRGAQASAEPRSRASDGAARVIGRRMAGAEEPCRGSARRARAQGP